MHLEPLGLYSKKVKDLKDIKAGQTIAVPNDTTNEGRALQLLAANGLITLKDGVGTNAKLSDITDKKGLEFKELEAATVPRALNDVDAAVINGNYAIEAKLQPAKDALVLEKAEDNPYANFLAVKDGQREGRPRPEAREAPQLRRGQEVHRGHLPGLRRPGLRPRRQVLTPVPHPRGRAPRTPPGCAGLRRAHPAMHNVRPMLHAVPLHGLRHGAAHDYHLSVRLHQHGSVGAAPLRHDGRPRAHRDDERRTRHRLDRGAPPLHPGRRGTLGPPDRPRASAPSGDGIVFAVTEFLTQRLVGSCGSRTPTGAPSPPRSRYVTAPWARGEGYATESVLAVAQWLFRDQGFERIELRTAADNTASQQVAQKIGCISEGVLRNARIARTQTEDGGWTDIRTDLIVWGLLPEDLEGVAEQLADAGGYGTYSDWN